MSACTPSPIEDLLPHLIAPFAGQAPFWVVAQTHDRWHGPDKPVKTLFAFLRIADNEVRVRGRRLDAPGAMLFRDGDDPRVTEVTYDLGRWGVRPGGATDEEMLRWSFYMTDAIVPAPGCWAFEASHAGSNYRVVLEIK